MLRPCLLLIGVLASIPAAAQSSQSQTGNTDEQQSALPQPQSQPLRPAQPGRLADSTVGEVGQRQTRGQTRGIAPTARLSTRIPNRIQSRLRNRIDRYYDPQANATSPFVVAAEETRAAGRARR